MKDTILKEIEYNMSVREIRLVAQKINVFVKTFIGSIEDNDIKNSILAYCNEQFKQLDLIYDTKMVSSDYFMSISPEGALILNKDLQPKQFSEKTINHLSIENKRIRQLVETPFNRYINSLNNSIEQLNSCNLSEIKSKLSSEAEKCIVFISNLDNPELHNLLVEASQTLIDTLSSDIYDELEINNAITKTTDTFTNAKNIIITDIQQFFGKMFNEATYIDTSKIKYVIEEIKSELLNDFYDLIP